jgi:hypothetical protein
VGGGSAARSERIRLIFAASAFAGTAIPIGWVISWPRDLPVFVLLVGLLLFSLVLYVSLIRTRLMSVATGIGLVVIAVGLPIPGYPQFFGGNGLGVWGYVMIVVPGLCFVVWLTGFILDLLIRAGRRIGGAIWPGSEEEESDAPPVPVPVRPGVAVGWVQAEGIVTQPDSPVSGAPRPVEYRLAPPQWPPVNPAAARPVERQPPSDDPTPSNGPSSLDGLGSADGPDASDDLGQHP